MNGLNKKTAILSAQLALLCANSKSAIFTASILAIILAYMVSGEVAFTLVFSWLALVILISLARLAMAENYQRLPVNDYPTLQARLKKFRLGISIAGLVWGSAGILMFPLDNLQQQMFLTFVLVGMSTAVIVSYSVDLYSAIVFSVSVVLPLIIRLFAVGNNSSAVMGVVGILYLGFIVINSFHSNKRILENLALHFEASERENAIKASDDWHRSILNRCMDGFWLVDMQERLLQVNETYCQMSGYSEQELLAMHICDLEAIESPDDVVDHMQKIIAKGEDRFETAHRRKDGSIFEVEVSVQYRAVDDGLLVVFLQDITQRKQAEATRQEVQMRFQKIASRLPGVIYQFRLRADGSSCFPFASEAINQIYRVSPEEVREDATKVFAILHPEDYDNIVISIQKSAQNLTPWRHEYRVKFDDGTVRWLSGNALPEREGEGATLWHGYITDITERKLAEIELHIAAIALETQEGVIITDANREIIRVNHAFIDTTGYTAEEVIGKNPRMLSSGRHDAAFYTAMWECINNTGTWSGEVWNQRKNGEIYPEHLTITAVQDTDGIVTNYVATLLDITDSKQIEQNLIDSEYRWKFAIEGSGDGVWDVNVQTQEANYSKRWKEMLGFAEDEALTTRQEWISRIHSDDRARVLELGQEYLDGKADSYVVEYRLQCKDGQYKWMLSRGMVVSRDQDGKPLRMIGTQADITEQKLAESTLMQMQVALQESHDRFKDLYEFAPIGYLTISSHGLITQLNWRASAMLGMDRKSIIHQRFTQFIDESDKGRWSRMFLAMKELATTEELSFDLKFTLHNGMTFIANLNCARMDDADKQSMLRVTLEDVTMIKKSEADLRVAATAFESQDGLMITDADNKILKVNKAFSTITGFTDAEVVGKTPHMLASGRHDAAFYAVMWDSLNKTGRWTGEIWNRRKGGDVYPENLTITAVKGEKGVVTNYVATFTDISMMKAAADEIQQLAFFDSLTHLPNRRLLMDRLKHALSASARSGRQGAVLFLDLDHFKVLNDSLGHDIGDLLLQQVAGRLTACVREGDTVARLGGDEYVVVLEDLSEQDLEAAAQTETIANKILAALNQPYKLNEHEHHITPSIGIAVFKNHHSTIEELLKQADIAMYQAKKAGRNTLRFFNPQMQISITARVALERELRKAIDNKQLHLYYQIQVDNLGHPLGAEALIRWLHPERGLVSPAQFIPLAEETGLILPIGHWVLDTACAQIKAWHKNAHTRDLTLSINVSAKQFRQADFVAQVQAAIERHSIDPMQLKIELTESLLLENIEDTIGSMTALGEIGVQFSLDDFGTGYSSLQYLKRLPLFQLKIDQSFVRDIVTDSHDRSIVRTVIAMAQSLYLNVIAEGVETEEQRELLLSNGCKRYQGYLFGKPVPIDQFNAALKQGK